MAESFIQEGELALRAIRKEDREAFLTWHNDCDLREKIGGIFPFRENTFQAICESYDAPFPANIWFAVCDADRLIGIAGLHSIKYIQRNAEVALLIGEKQERKQGKGSRVLKLLEDYAFGTMNLHRLYAYIYADNKDALCCIEKCHWLHEGTLKEASFWNYRFRDVEIWAKINTQEPTMH
jgi:RimJ/RimL family protein N-acetyltransferase